MGWALTIGTIATPVVLVFLAILFRTKATYLELYKVYEYKAFKETDITQKKKDLLRAKTSLEREWKGRIKDPKPES